MLIDEQRYALLERESRETGRSVGAIVRGAIDDHFAVEDAAAQRAAAIEWLLARPAGSGPDWKVTKAALEAEIEDRVR